MVEFSSFHSYYKGSLSLGTSAFAATQATETKLPLQSS